MKERPIKKEIYLDANASARIRPEIDEAVEILKNVRNPSSVHALGRHARMQLTNARKNILALLNAGQSTKGQRLVFTSGATEACNLLIFSFLGEVADLTNGSWNIVVSSIEHPAILEPIKILEKKGFKIKKINPRKNGIVEIADFVNAVDENTLLLAIMTVNNETGAVQPVAKIAKSLREKNYNGLIVSDFTQALTKTSIVLNDLFEAGVNAVAVSGHKIGAPSGIGALIINEAYEKACFSYRPILRGGAQENSYRAGTENILAAVCFGLIAKNALVDRDRDLSKRSRLREMLWQGLKNIYPEIIRLTPENTTCASSNTLLVLLPHYRADDLLVGLDLEGVFVSSGSACASGKQGVSHVVTAMGYSEQEARGALRFSLDWDATEADIKEALIRIEQVFTRMRNI